MEMFSPSPLPQPVAQDPRASSLPAAFLKMPGSFVLRPPDVGQDRPCGSRGSLCHPNCHRLLHYPDTQKVSGLPRLIWGVGSLPGLGRWGGQLEAAMDRGKQPCLCVGGRFCSVDVWLDGRERLLLTCQGGPVPALSTFP